VAHDLAHEAALLGPGAVGVGVLEVFGSQGAEDDPGQEDRPGGEDGQAGPEVDVDAGCLGLGLVGGEQSHDGQDHAVQGEQAAGPVDIIGFSSGGEVAQYLAADHGELVGRLVLSDTGCRLGEDARALLRAARDKAAKGRAAEAQADIANQMDFGRLGQGLVKLLGKRLMREPGDPSDYIAAIEADLGHDATGALPGIVAPTLVVAGSRDFFFPEPIVRETAELIPHATLRIYDGVGHAVGKTHKRRFESEVLGFLRG
jgi:pimeloyl-ACP methyl ester carboxylesterase